jgi:hypothetical protein
MNFRLFIFATLFMLGRAAHIAAHIVAVLAKGAVGARVLFRDFLFHNCILQSFTAKTPIGWPKVYVYPLK